MKAPITLNVGADIDVEVLARRLLAEQTEKVGSTYGYCCDCGLAVTKRQVWAYRRRKSPPRCGSCGRRAGVLKRRSTDPIVYLCVICRAVLTGRQRTNARYRASKGIATSCGSSACKSAARKQASARVPRLPCSTCGNDSTSTSSYVARCRGTRAFCEKHKGGRI